MQGDSPSVTGCCFEDTAGSDRFVNLSRSECVAGVVEFT